VRTDNDNWDITTSVGSTALNVATARALEAQKPDPLAVDPFAELFCRAVGGTAAAVLDGKAPGHQLKTPDWGKHFVSFQGARTRFFDNYFRRAADDGVRQVVILAAGLDSRAYRLSWPAQTTIFELDRPQVLDFKREVLAEQGAKPNAQRREVAIDLREDWPQALRDSGFDATKPSAWIAEGLLIYLPAAAEEQLFSGIDALAARAVTPPWKTVRQWRRTSWRLASKKNVRLGLRAMSGCSFNWSTTSAMLQPTSGSASTAGPRKQPGWGTTCARWAGRFLGPIPRPGR